MALDAGSVHLRIPAQVRETATERRLRTENRTLRRELEQLRTAATAVVDGSTTGNPDFTYVRHELVADLERAARPIGKPQGATINVALRWDAHSFRSAMVRLRLAVDLVSARHLTELHRLDAAMARACARRSALRADRAEHELAAARAELDQLRKVSALEPGQVEAVRVAQPSFTSRQSRNERCREREIVTAARRLVADADRGLASAIGQDLELRAFQLNRYLVSRSAIAKLRAAIAAEGR